MNVSKTKVKYIYMFVHQRYMFFACVLTGYSTLGGIRMKVCPKDYHTTTDGEHIYVTYHDTQAYGQYLIYYQ